MLGYDALGRLPLGQVRSGAAVTVLVISTTSPGAITLRRSGDKSPSITQGQTVSLRRSALKLAQVTQAQIISVARNLAGHILILFPGSVSLSRDISHRVPTITQGETVTTQKQQLKPVGITQDETVSLRRNMSPYILVAQDQLVTLGRNLVHRISFLQGLIVQLIRTHTRTPISILSPNVLVVRKMAMPIVSLAQGMSVTFGQNLARLVQITQDQLIILKTFNYRNIFFGQGQEVTVERNVSTILSLVQDQLSTVLRDTYHQVIYYTDQTVSMVKNQGKPFMITLAQNVSMGRSILKLLREYNAQHITVNAPRERRINIQQTESVRLLRRTGHTVSASGGQTILLSRDTAARILISQSQAVRIAQATAHVIRVSLAQAVSLPRSVRHAVSLAGGQVASLVRAVGHRVAVSGIGQLVSVIAHPVHHYSVLIAASLGQAVSAVLRRGKFAGIVQPQLVTVARNIFKTIWVWSSQTVTLILDPVIRFLNPSLFSFGLQRRRTVYEVPNVAQTNALVPPIQPLVEQEVVEFDYGLTMAEGAKIVSAEVTCTVYSGVDEAPATRLIGYLVVAVSTRNGRPAQAVRQMVGDMLDGVVYSLQCVANTDDGQKLALTTTLSCEAPQ